MHFQNFRTKNPKHNSLRWGIASSDIPTQKPDPAPPKMQLMQYTIELIGRETLSAEHFLAFFSADAGP